MASDLSSGCMETIDILDDEKEEGEISLEDVSSSEEGGIGHLTCNYVISRTRLCPDCKSWGECAPWCTMMCHSKSRRDPVKGKENRHHVREAGCATAKHIASTLQEKNDDLVPISSDSDMEIVGLTDTSNRSKTRIKKKKRKKRDYDIITIDDLISPAPVDLPITEFGTLKKTHYRELSPVRRSSRSRVISRSPIRRYRSPVKTRSSIRSSRSPLNRIRSPMLRRSPRRLRSPKRISPHRSPKRSSPHRSPKRSSPHRSPKRGSPHRSPKRSSPHRSPKRSSPHRSEPVRATRRPSRLNSPLSTRSYANRHGDVTKLLKKVKHLDSMGVLTSESSVDRSKEHQPSLKEKLSNMLKKHPDSNDNATCFKEKTNTEPDIVNDADDEEDLALLRQKALETKQKKSSRSSDHGPMDVELEKNPAAKNDDQDEEALQLRMIALRSAVMKKHQNRVRRGIRTNKKPSRSESPFSQSFLDDIPVPGDELLKFASPPCTPLYDSNRIEDMELDTDIEGEKEAELPYSPTDKITTHVPIDTSLLGIEPSDVSFINVNETNNKSTIFNDAKRIEGMPLLITDVAPCYDNAYLMSHTYEASQYYAYSPSQQCTDIFLGSDFNDEPGELSDHIRDCQSDDVVCDLIDGICCQVDSSTSVASTQVPDVRPIPVLTSLLPIPSTSPETQIIEQSTDDILLTNVDSIFRENKCTYEARKVSECPLTTISPTMYAEPVSNELIITIDDIPETKKNSLNSLVIDINLPTTDYISKEAVPCQAAEGQTLQEPLYMQGVPDITKDANKIPTLINKTLVPAPILRSNKRLQQPLPVTKKCETHVPEPSFKSAEMQPVIVTTNVQSAKNGSNFKPIKLRVARKSAPILTASIAFDNLTNENSENNAEAQGGGPSKDSCEVIEHSATANTMHTATANDDVVLSRKRRKRIKKDRSKSFGCIQLLAKKRNNSDDNVNKDVNIKFSSTIEQQITESDLSESNNDNKVQESLMENGESKLQNAIDTQESISCSNITVENKDTEKSDLSLTLSNPTEHPQERNVESRLSINSASDNLDSDASNKASQDVGNRRQSVDEDENELRAILLASLKRTKLIDINSNSSTISITTNCATTNTQTPIQQTLTDTISIAAINSTQATVNSNVPLSTRLSSLVTQEKKINRVSSSLLASGNKKKISSVNAVKGPPKKMMKKSVIPASTKVVNNAKKYQNMIVQRRLNLRKLDNNTTKSNENVWSNANPSKTSLHVSDTQRFVISLGSDTDSESDGEKPKDSDLVPTIEKHQTQDISADFEQSLHKFLRDMRKEQEQSVAIVTKPVTTRDAPLVTKGSSNMHTPLAVRHLPASQQEEYRRLKQEILEREKLKLQRKVADNNNSGSNNKLLNTNTASSLIKSLSSSEMKSMPIKQNSDKSTESERNSQQSSGESKKKNINAARNSLISNVFHTPANSDLSLNVDKHTNSAYSSAKGVKKTIPNNLSIRITNEIAPNHTAVESRTVENSCEKQSANDKPQNNRPALRALTKEEINRKYVQVLLKSDISGRVVTINDRPALRHDTTNVSQSEKPVGNDVSTEILEDRQRNNENSNNTSVFSNASTVKLLDSAANLNTSKPEHEDIMMETTMSLSQYEAESRREINCNTSMSLSSENNSNNAFHKSDSENVDNKGNTDDVWDALKKNVKEELDSLINLPKTEQERYLRDTEHKLVARRYTVLDHLAEMSGNLRQWDMEKELQSSLASEVRKLKEQLKMAEERLQLQRDRVNSMGPKVSTARQKINAGRRECFKLSRICSTLGNRLMGKIYKLPEAGGQLLSDKLKEVANHTRQFTKKKRIQFNDASENSNSNLLRQISESSKDTRVEEDLSLQEQPVNDAADVAGSKNDTCRLKQYNDSGNLSTSESSFTLSVSQTFLNQLTPAKRKETSTNASELHNDEQITPPNQDVSEPKLYQSTPVEQNKKHRQRSCSTHDPITSSELGSLSTDPFSCQDNEQNNKKMSSPPLSMSTTKMTATTTTTTTTMTIAPYESILSHLKAPRNTNPHGILCPYEMMGICRDEDCQYIHQSRNQT
ncbi:serine-rich adhesin for platelets [Polyergus mexicanus]|uniref:serine-rich adhesin for platelets n=1 Tax=Polyergus mexicanus TaxID=615972 RepID=UPI0038B62B5B